MFGIKFSEVGLVFSFHQDVSNVVQFLDASLKAYVRHGQQAAFDVHSQFSIGVLNMIFVVFFLLVFCGYNMRCGRFFSSSIVGKHLIV